MLEMFNTLQGGGKKKTPPKQNKARCNTHTHTAQQATVWPEGAARTEQFGPHGEHDWDSGSKRAAKTNRAAAWSLHTDTQSRNNTDVTKYSTRERFRVH